MILYSHWNRGHLQRLAMADQRAAQRRFRELLPSPATVRLADPGRHNLVAVYSGDANNAAGQSWPVPVTVSAAPVFESIEVNGGIVTLVWSAPANQNFTVQFNTDLTARSWTNLGSVVTASNSPTTCTGRDRIESPEILSFNFRSVVKSRFSLNCRMASHLHVDVIRQKMA